VQRGLGVCVLTALVLASAAAARNFAANGRIGYLRPLGGNEKGADADNWGDPDHPATSRRSRQAPLRTRRSRFARRG
jgi:hypothetical protein